MDVDYCSVTTGALPPNAIEPLATTTVCKANSTPIKPASTGNAGPPDVACDGATRPHPADEWCMDDAIYGGISVNGALDSPS